MLENPLPITLEADAAAVAAGEIWKNHVESRTRLKTSQKKIDWPAALLMSPAVLSKVEGGAAVATEISHVISEFEFSPIGHQWKVPAMEQ